MRKPQELPLPGTPRPALRLVHFESQTFLDPVLDPRQHTLRRRFTANINVTVFGKVNIIFPTQGDSGTHVNISGAGATKSGKNKENSIKLIEFLSGDAAQKIYAEDNFEYPVKAGTALHPLVASWGKFKADTVYLSKIAEHRARATRIMDEVRFDN